MRVSTPTRLRVNGDGELPTLVPARNQGAVVAIDPHQTAAAAVMTSMQTATETASAPPTLRWVNLISKRRAMATATADHVAIVALNRIATTRNRN